VTTRTIAVCSIALLSGCQHSDYAQRRISERERNLAWTVDQYVESERSRPAKFRNSIALMGRIAEEDAHQLDYNLRWFGSMIESDARRFEARQPIYRATILDILDGKPESIEKTAIDLFY
jgi:hypothetical protein